MEWQSSLVHAWRAMGLQGRALTSRVASDPGALTGASFNQGSDTSKCTYDVALSRAHQNKLLGTVLPMKGSKTRSTKWLITGQLCTL